MFDYRSGTRQADEGVYTWLRRNQPEEIFFEKVLESSLCLAARPWF